MTKPAAPSDHAGGSVRYYKRDFWGEENLKFSNAHYRLRKSAAIVNKIAGTRSCDLLDVGCGPGTLAGLLRPNIAYHGIDIAIQEPAPNLIEQDLAEAPISFRGQKFDIVVAQGFFEYLGSHQEQKFAEIHDLLAPGGRLVASYVNFGHRDSVIYGPYNNVQPFRQFKDSLSRYLTIEKYFPTSHNWHHWEPNRPLLQALQVPVRLPVISRYLAVEYFFICTRRRRRAARVTVAPAMPKALPPNTFR